MERLLDHSAYHQTIQTQCNVKLSSFSLDYNLYSRYFYNDTTTWKVGKGQYMEYLESWGETVSA